MTDRKIEDNQVIAKSAAAQEAVKLIEPKMKIGLGSGSTAKEFIKLLGQRCRLENLDISVLPSSLESAAIARQEKIPIESEGKLSRLDLTIDGADEVDRQKRLIKGGGGALLREKIVAAMSDEMVVIIDQSKLVDNLGRFPLAVEIAAFSPFATLRHLEAAGFQAQLRKQKNGRLFNTDNGNLLIDIHFYQPLKNPEEVDRRLKQIPGVLETGFFFHLAKKIIIGFSDGKVKFIS